MSNGVGTDLGNVYKSKEGFGRAFILPEDDDALKALNFLVANQAKQQAAAKKTKSDKEKAAKSKLKELSQTEWWVKHDNELQGNMDKLLQLGSNLMAAGIKDPFSSTNPAAQQFQKEALRIQNRAQNSKQLKAMYNNTQQKIEQNPKMYSPESIKSIDEYYNNNNLETIEETGAMPPRLKHIDPAFDMQKYYGTFASNLGAKNEDPSDMDFREVIGIGLNDPANAGYKDALASQLDDMMQPENKLQLDALKATAEDLGLDPEKDLLQALGVTQLKSYFGTKPIDVPLKIKDFLPKVHKYAKTEEDVAGVKQTTKNWYLQPEKLKNAAKAFIDLNPRVVQQLLDDGAIEKKADAQEWVEKYMSSQVETLFETSVTREKDGKYGGYGEDEANKDNDIWYQAFNGNYPADGTPEEKLRNQRKATEYANGAELPGGRTIRGGIVSKRKEDVQGLINVARGLAPFESLDYEFYHYGAEDINNWDPNVIYFDIETVEDVEYVDPITQEKKKRKDVKHKYEQYQFNQPGARNFLQKDDAQNIHRDALKKKGVLFVDMLDESAEQNQPARDKEIERQKKSKPKIDVRGGGTGTTKPTDTEETDEIGNLLSE